MALSFYFNPAVTLCLVGIGIASFGAAMLCIFIVRKVAGRKHLAFVDELKMDNHLLRYTEYRGRTESIGWNDIRKVEYYYGEPDFPDPLVGMAPVPEWRVYGERSFISLRDSHNARLIKHFTKRLPGFRTHIARRVISNRELGTWILWDQDSERPNSSLQPTPQSGAAE